jgi:hypothetical protein
MVDMLTEFKESPNEDPVAKPAEGAEPDNLVVDPARKALVEDWIKRIKASKKHFKADFDRMDTCMQLASEGADEAWIKSEHYIVPIINRHINQAVAQLYAKDPRAVATRRRKMLFTLWDGDPQTYAAALLATQPPQVQDPMTGAAMPAPMPIDPMTGMAQPWQPDPNAVALVEEVQAAVEYNRMAEKIGQTNEILWKYFTGEQANGFKQQMKAAVRRTKVCGISWVKLLYQRELKKQPEIGAQIDDATSQIAALEALQTQVAAGEVDENDAKLDELRNLLKQLQEKEYVVTREGPVFDFPRAKEIIIDKKCRHLKTLTGARWLAHEFEMTPDEVLENYKVDLKKHFTEHKAECPDQDDEPSMVAKVYEVQDKKLGQCFTVVEGYPDFIKEPYDPDVKIERVFTLFPIVFNEIEHDKKLYPPSDVWLLRHPQADMNRARESKREHRIAARPKYATPKGTLDKADKDKLESGSAHCVVELKALRPGQAIDTLLQEVPVAKIDPNLYEVSEQYTDVLRTVGTQEANLGGTSDSSATESSIAESSRQASLADNVDDLDDMLTELARAFSQLCLMEMSPDSVKEICGPGAVWPDLQGNRQEIAKDLLLDIQAGSSGRPNKAADLANMERGMPYLVQIPGINPKGIAKKYVTLLDLDPDEIMIDGMPSIVAQNAMASKAAQQQPGTGDSESDPQQQGGEGAQNAPGPGPNQNEPGAQPAFPAPS